MNMQNKHKCRNNILQCDIITAAYLQIQIAVHFSVFDGLEQPETAGPLAQHVPSC